MTGRWGAGVPVPGQTAARRVTGLAAVLVAGLAAACGASVSSDPLVRAPARPDDAEVLVFVRSESPPRCPWEVLGTVGEEGAGPLDEGPRLGAARRAVARMGGDALLLAAAGDARGQVIRFLDPRRLCDPLVGPDRP
ncbi:MAG: hypothetical protein RRA92_10760 [Gemmatimonadota bacterium]|nr:hypothetical protein [Gemmatimonadota bacterium]